MSLSDNMIAGFTELAKASRSAGRVSAFVEVAQWIEPLFDTHPEAIPALRKLLTQIEYETGARPARGDR